MEPIAKRNFVSQHNTLSAKATTKNVEQTPPSREEHVMHVVAKTAKSSHPGAQVERAKDA